jgi:hypothetical protein
MWTRSQSRVHVRYGVGAGFSRRSQRHSSRSLRQRGRVHDFPGDPRDGGEGGCDGEGADGWLLRGREGAAVAGGSDGERRGGSVWRLRRREGAAAAGGSDEAVVAAH